jgi:hypothetical protein
VLYTIVRTHQKLFILEVAARIYRTFAGFINIGVDA